MRFHWHRWLILDQFEHPVRLPKTNQTRVWIKSRAFCILIQRIFQYRNWMDYIQKGWFSHLANLHTSRLHATLRSAQCILIDRQNLLFCPTLLDFSLRRHKVLNVQNGKDLSHNSIIGLNISRELPTSYQAYWQRESTVTGEHGLWWEATVM